MPLIELRTLSRSKANYIRSLQYRFKIAKLVSDAGYLSYDEEELERYKKSCKIGRPIKLN